ncbi:hypothetical protein ACQP0I_05205 [Micromonospora carbonacea]|uniref:hypothetical protein n=1 Tax=Micromonospora carbonacea TaxID=47853 RepID=UPI003D9659D2
MSAILDFFRLWWGGKLPDHYALWGFLPIFWVARIAKTLQILAGLAVVFDLFKAGWLTDWAKRSDVRAEERNIMILYQNRLDAMERDLVYVRPPMSKSSDAVLFLIRRQPERVPQGVGVNLDTYRKFHRDVIERAKCKNTCNERVRPGAVCSCQTRYARHRIKEFATKQLPANERAIIAGVNHFPGGVRPLLIYLSVAMATVGFCLSGLASFLSERLASESASFGILILSTAALVAIAAAPFSSMVQLEWYRASKRLADYLIRRAEKPLPFLGVRVSALIVFVIGAVLDLVAS